MVEQIKGFKAKLHVEVLRNRRGLHGAEVHAHVSRPAEGTATGGSEDLERGRLREGRKVPPIEEGLGPAVGIPKQVAVVLLKANVADRSVARSEAGCGKACPDKTNTADLPSAQYLLHWAGPTAAPMPAFAKGKLVQRAIDPIKLCIEGRWSVIQLEVVDVRGGKPIATVAGP